MLDLLQFNLPEDTLSSSHAIEVVLLCSCLFYFNAIRNVHSTQVNTCRFNDFALAHNLMFKPKNICKIYMYFRIDFFLEHFSFKVVCSCSPQINFSGI